MCPAFLSRAKEKEEEKEEKRKRRKSERRMQNNKGTEALANFRTLRRDNLPGKHFGHWAKIYLLNNYLVQIKL